MAEVPPGPNALTASPAEIIPLPVDGCSIRASDEKVDCGRGDGITLGTEPKGAIKPNQNHVHPNSSAQLHSALKHLNGVGDHPEDEGQGAHAPVHNHVRHPAHREPDNQKAVSGRFDSFGEALAEHTGNTFTKNKRGSSSSRSLPNNGIDSTAIPETTPSRRPCDSTCLRAGGGRTVGHFLLADSNDIGQKDDDQKGPWLHGTGVEQAVASVTAELGSLSLTGGQTAESTISYVRYESELQMPDIIRLITKDLSEPYSIYTYRYFIHNWPQLCFLAMVEKTCVGAIVCKLDMHKKMFRRGYIAMLAVDSKFRRKGIGTSLVKKAIYAMVDGDCDEVVLETEITNKSALKLYENLGFVRDKRLFRYYLNGVDALRLKLWLR
ncbi:hypothetical protein P4O66_011968 [Electrophorus voltai]|uniref:N-alpha-acetyltransferase 30 n=1 Tax=Electrophorus voltai TaxID=2609070 RepID=A0AAD8Z6U6_9TELE|nr:hypothetical protein P4O66_011968 [Electrophorus voltai]